jgi:hypothetical protein
MAIPNFRELLSTATDAVERPKPLAAGHYIGQVKGHEFGVSKTKQTPYVRFILTPTEETNDIPDGANTGITLANRELRRDFYLTPTALYRLSDALDAMLGKAAGRTFDVRIPETRGVRIMFHVTQREVTDNDGAVTDIYNDVDTIVAAPM